MVSRNFDHTKFFAIGYGEHFSNKPKHQFYPTLFIIKKPTIKFGNEKRHTPSLPFHAATDALSDLVSVVLFG